MDKFEAINKLCTEAFVNASNHGWHDFKREVGTVLMLITTELAEAMEEHRGGKPLYYMKNNKPEGYAVELIDALIRIFDELGSLMADNADIDAGYILREKMKYNESRSYRHGNKLS